MLEIIQDSDQFIIISNGNLSLKFFKTGPLQGFYEIVFFDNIAIKNVYSNIKFHEETLDDLIEIKSTQTSYITTVDEIVADHGKGFKLLISPSDKANLDVYFIIQFELYDNSDFFLVSLTNIEDRSNSKRKVHSISPFTIKNSKLYLNGLKTPTNLEKMIQSST